VHDRLKQLQLLAEAFGLPKAKYGDDWGKQLSEWGQEALKAKYGDDHMKQLSERGQEALKSKYWDDHMKQLSELAQEALQAKPEGTSNGATARWGSQFSQTVKLVKTRSDGTIIQQRFATERQEFVFCKEATWRKFQGDHTIVHTLSDGKTMTRGACDSCLRQTIKAGWKLKVRPSQSDSVQVPTCGILCRNVQGPLLELN
jgi:hypothetical protein